jgi:hypothetical protein
MFEFLELKNSFNFFFLRSHTYRLSNRKDKKEKNSLFFDKFYDINKKFIYNKFKVLSLKLLSRKYKMKYKRSNFSQKIKGLSLFKSFLNNYIKLTKPFKPFKRIKNRRRIELNRKKVTINFRNFFYFIFFFYLNKFNIVIDSYNRKNFSIYYLVRLFKFKNKRKKFKYNNINTDMFLKKLRFIYLFRYKSKKLYKKRRQKRFGSFFDSFRKLNRNKINMAFTFFY